MPFTSERLSPQSPFGQIHNTPLDTIVLIKLLYLADRKALLESGYTITGDGMVSMPLGPVLSTIYDWIQYGFVTTQVDRLKAFRGPSCMTTQNFGHLSWRMK